MCGLVGVFGASNYRMQNVFKDLLQVDVVRGHHSTGASFVPADMKKDFVLLKEAWLPQELMATDEFKQGVNRDNIVKMGHNRLATMGAVNQQNAHPFFYEGKAGRFIGAHNGTLKNKWELERKAKGKFDTDSQALFSLISQKGLGEAWKVMNGAAAVSLFELTNRTLTLATNGERPLCYTILPSKRQVLWASEGWMIQAACYRRDIDPGKVIAIPKNKGVLFWMKGDAVKHQVFKLEPRPFDMSRGGSVGYTAGGNYWQRLNDKKDRPYYVWDSDLDEWVRKEKKGSVTIITPVGKSLPSSSDQVWSDLPRFRDDIDKREQTDHRGYYNSLVYEEVYFHTHFKSCEICKTDLIDEYGNAVITADIGKRKEAVCAECYLFCEDEGFDPGRGYNK